MKDNLFQWACKEIETEEKRLGHKRSWRFLLTPKRTLSPSSKIAFISLNPGDRKDEDIPPDHGKESCEKGCALNYEEWKSPIKEQIKMLFKEIAYSLYKKPDKSLFLMDNSLMAYYIPFRSENFNDLVKKEKSCHFAYELWEKIFKNITPELIITIDRHTFKNINKILNNSHKLKKSLIMPTGWGNINASINFYVNPGGHVVIVRFPHFSWFKIFSHPESKPHIREIVIEMTKFMV